MAEHVRGECGYCGKRFRVTKGGRLYGHGTCVGGGADPVEGTVVTPSPPTPEYSWWLRRGEDILWGCILVLVFTVGMVAGWAVFR